jgi:integrase/recombinase XerD
VKKIVLNNQSFRYLEQSFKEWLDVLGYAPSSVYYLPLHVRELLYYLEQQEIKNITTLDTKHIQNHYNKLKERTNQKRGGGLSNAHLNKHIQAIKKFADYLRKVGRMELPEIKLKHEETASKITFLNEEEIQLLYQATHKDPNRKYVSVQITEALQARDRAMLTIFYGCGLRRNEGVHVDVSDINFDRSMLHVRKGKNYKERFVPISKTSLKHLTEYIYDYRPELLKDSRTAALFIGSTGKRMQGQGLYVRLKILQYNTENTDLQEKEIGLHILRHSIATHLLQAGMKLESISRFLGHNSLESTQIYTHLSEIPQSRTQAYNNIPKREITQLEDGE